ncbi:2,3-bisphosphoglycerate-dependent phosphoglycerate mutase [Candidatus Woesearchaeota archaeon]|nr:2,3-bisphosphoglycerate-dependent phosphoglycerate mutase [Candidatus Woesearchaeota archaeon]
MKKHIYLFRHGQSYYNKKHVFTGWKDSRLTPLGVRQAKVIARKLKNKRIDVAVQTSLSRSKDTLKQVLKYHPECKIIITNDKMLERSYGKLEGRSHESFIEEEGEDSYKTLLHWHKIDHLPAREREKFIKRVGTAEYDIIHRSYDVPPPKGESVKMVEKRVLSFIKELLKFIKREKVNVAISAHGNSMRPFRRYFEKLSIKQMMELENPWDDYFDYVVEV